MSAKVIQVLLTDAEEYPDHGNDGPKHLELWPIFRGTAILIFAKAEVPGPMWICDTDHVWEVVPDWYDAEGPGSHITRRADRVMVCRHQIQIGD